MLQLCKVTCLKISSKLNLLNFTSWFQFQLGKYGGIHLSLKIQWTNRKNFKLQIVGLCFDFRHMCLVIYFLTHLIVNLHSSSSEYLTYRILWYKLNCFVAVLNTSLYKIVFTFVVECLLLYLFCFVVVIYLWF